MPKMSISSVRNYPRRSQQSSEEPTETNPNSSTPAEDSELEQLAQHSRGESRFSGLRGLVADQGKHNHENYSLQGGLDSFQEGRDRHPETTESFQRDQEKQAKLQADLDRAADGPKRGGRKAAPKGGEQGGANDSALYK